MLIRDVPSPQYWVQDSMMNFEQTGNVAGKAAPTSNRSHHP